MEQLQDFLLEHAFPAYAAVKQLFGLVLPPARLLYFTLIRLFYSFQANPDPRTIFTVLIVIFTGVLAARTFVRYLIAQIRLALQMAVYTGLLTLVVWLWARGPAGVISDMGDLAGFCFEQPASAHVPRHTVQRKVVANGRGW